MLLKPIITCIKFVPFESKHTQSGFGSYKYVFKLFLDPFELYKIAPNYCCKYALLNLYHNVGSQPWPTRMFIPKHGIMLWILQGSKTALRDQYADYSITKISFIWYSIPPIPLSLLLIQYNLEKTKEEGWEEQKLGSNKPRKVLEFVSHSDSEFQHINWTKHFSSFCPQLSVFYC